MEYLNTEAIPHFNDYETVTSLLAKKLWEATPPEQRPPTIYNFRFHQNPNSKCLVFHDPHFVRIEFYLRNFAAQKIPIVGSPHPVEVSYIPTLIPEIQKILWVPVDNHVLLWYPNLREDSETITRLINGGNVILSKYIDVMPPIPNRTAPFIAHRLLDNFPWSISDIPEEVYFTICSITELKEGHTDPNWGPKSTSGLGYIFCLQEEVDLTVEVSNELKLPLVFNQNILIENARNILYDENLESIQKYNTLMSLLKFASVPCYQTIRQYMSMLEWPSKYTITNLD